MKRILKQLCLMWMALCLPASTLWASSALVEASRKGQVTISSLKAGTTVILSNQFGNITLVPWDKKDLRLDFELKVMAKDKAVTEEILKNMGIEKRETSGACSLELRGTDMGSNEERKIESHWTVYIPKEKLMLTVTNRFGNVNIPDYACKTLSAHVKFGTLQCGTLQTDEQMCELKVEHGKLKLADSKTANVHAQFSTVEITRCPNLVLTVRHAEQVNIGTCTDLRLTAMFSGIALDAAQNATVSLQHSKLTAKAVRSINCSLSHSGIDIQELAETLSIPSAQHSDIKASVVSAKNFKSASAQALFSAVSLKIPKGLEATYLLENQHGSIDIDKNIKTLNHTAAENRFTKSYTGSIGKASASALIKFSGTHSTISLKQN